MKKLTVCLFFTLVFFLMAGCTKKVLPPRKVKRLCRALITHYENYLSFLKEHGLDVLSEEEYYSEEELLIVKRYRERYQ